MTGRIALAFGDRQYTASWLGALASGLAGTLARRGVRAGERVALMSSNRPEFIVAVQAIWRLGAAAVLLSPAWKQGEVEHALAITDPAHAAGDHPVLAGMMPMLDLDEPIEPAPGSFAPPDPATDAVLVFSSGTTGLPKAARHTHASFGAAVRHWRDALELTARDRMQITTPPSHILGLLNIVTALETGAWLRLHPRFDLADADRVARLEKAVAATGWRALRSDGASGVEVAIVAEEFARGLLDVPFLGPVLADDLRLAAAGGTDPGLTGPGVTGSGRTEPGTIAVGTEAIDARGIERGSPCGTARS